MQREGRVRGRARSIGVGVVGLALVVAAAAVVLNPPASGTGSDPSTATSAPATTAPPDSGDGTDAAADADGSSSGGFGWGAAQPPQMRASVQFGGSDEPISDERRALLGRQLEQARAAALAVGTVAEAERQGFEKNYQRIDGRGFEYINWDRFSTFDLDKPSMLVFADDTPDSPVVSMAYNVLGTVEAGPPRDLPLENIPWHFHADLCEKDGSIIGSDEPKRCAAEGAAVKPELNHWMVDLWVIPGWENPWGLVSSVHPDLTEEPTPWFDESHGFCLLQREDTRPTSE